MRRWFGLPLLLALTLPLWATAPKFAPPTDFKSGYQLPTTFNPLPRAEWLAYLDVAVLVLFLALAAYLVLRVRSRRGVLALTIASLLYFGFFRHGCVCSVGSLQNVTLSLFSGYTLPLVVAGFFLLPLLFALFFGRVFCAAVCPLGAVQEVVLLRPLRVTPWLEHALGVLPFVYLGAAVLFAATGSAFLICQYDPFVLFFRFDGNAVMLVASIAMLLISTVVGRPYCRFLCPYGVLLRLLAPLARCQVSITPQECINCRLCADACPYGAIRVPTTAMPPRREGKGRLALFIVLLPVLVAGGAILVRQASPALSRLHPVVRQAEQVWLKEQGVITEDTNEILAYELTGKLNPVLYHEATVIRQRFETGSTVLGAWIGLVIGVLLIQLSLRRRRNIHEADPAACVACGRCYASCPVGKPENVVAEEPALPTGVG